MNIEASKLELIKLIADEQSEVLIERLKQVFKQEKKAAAQGRKTETAGSQPEKASAAKDGAEDRESLWQSASQPIPAHITFEELAREQNYDGEKLRKAFKEWDYSLFEDQSLEELLNSLTP